MKKMTMSIYFQSDITSAIFLYFQWFSLIMKFVSIYLSITQVIIIPVIHKQTQIYIHYEHYQTGFPKFKNQRLKWIIKWRQAVNIVKWRQASNIGKLFQLMWKLPSYWDNIRCPLISIHSEVISFFRWFEMTSSSSNF